MKKTINYTINEFTESGYSSKEVRNIMTSSKEPFWESNSDYAQLSILFSPIKDFWINLCKV